MTFHKAALTGDRQALQNTLSGSLPRRPLARFLETPIHLGHAFIVLILLSENTVGGVQVSALYLISIPLAIGLARRPVAALVVLVFLSVINYPIAGSDWISGTSDLVLLAVTPCYFFCMLSSQRKNSYFLALTSISVLSALIAALSNNYQQSWFGFARWLLILVVVGGIAATVRSVSRRRLAASFYLALAAAASLAAIFGILQRSGFYRFVGPPYHPPDIDSTFGYYSNYSAFLAFAVVILLNAAFDIANLQGCGRALCAVASLLCLTQVGQGFSRGAIIYVGVGIGILLLGSLRTPKLAIAQLAAVVGSIILLVLTVPNSALKSTYERFFSAQGGDVFRRGEQQAGNLLLREHPLGLGFGGFYRELSTNVGIFPVPLAHPHRLWLAVGLEIGFVGVICMCLMVAIICFRLIRSWLHSPSVLAVGCIAALVATFVQGYNDYFFIETSNLSIFAVLLGIALCAQQDRRQLVLEIATVPYSLRDRSSGMRGRG
ncbi:O-antigen ligase family protein [Williamsia sp. M5A3_1d]